MKLSHLIGAVSLLACSGCVEFAGEPDDPAINERIRTRTNHDALGDDAFRNAVAAAFPDVNALRAARDKCIREADTANPAAAIAALRAVEWESNLLGLGESNTTEGLALCRRMSDLALAQAGDNDEIRLRIAALWSTGWILPRDTGRIATALGAMRLPDRPGRHYGSFGQEAAWAAWYFPKMDPACAAQFDAPKFKAELALAQTQGNVLVAKKIMGLFQLPCRSDTLLNFADVAVAGRAESLPIYQNCESNQTIPTCTEVSGPPVLGTFFVLGLKPSLIRTAKGEFYRPSSPDLIPAIVGAPHDNAYFRTYTYLSTLLNAEKGGNSRAIFILGMLSDRDGFEPLIPRTARATLAGATGRIGRAAALGDLAAKSVLGEWLYKGDGIPHDVPRAIRLWAEAAEAGEARSKALIMACITKKMPGWELAESLIAEAATR